MKTAVLSFKVKVMTIEIISPKQYNTIKWKNGLGETTELAISEGGDVDHFDWRLSIATVSEDGFFSDFSGYSRNLVLISGQGIVLEHDGAKVDCLDKLLDMASFDGGCKTYGKLTSGTIKDFNIMTKTLTVDVNVERYIEQQSITLAANNQYFVYALSTSAMIDCNNTTITLPTGHLLAISANNVDEIQIKGSQMIVIRLVKKS